MSLTKFSYNKKTSIVILTLNKLEYTKLCIESVRKYTTNLNYEIIVVDNKSTDGTVEWLKNQKDIKVIYNSSNMGFPIGCNQGISIATGENILLLNNDTVVTKNWLKNLLICLHSSKYIGAVCPVTNSASYYSTIPVNYKSLEEMQEFASNYNISDRNKWEERLKLIGFSMLIKREAINKIGLLDECFTPGNFEDDDFSIRLSKAGYRLMLCKDTFIHHFGSVSWKDNIDSYKGLLTENESKFKKKWGIEPQDFQIHYDLLKLIKKEKNKELNILHVGSQLGGTILEIKNKYKKSKVYGVSNKKGFNDYHFIDALHEEFDIHNYVGKQFDIILFTENNIKISKQIINQLIEKLKSDGLLLIKLANFGEYDVVRTLLEGYNPVNDTGIQFYSEKQVENLVGDYPHKLMFVKTNLSKEKKEEVSNISGLVPKKNLLDVQYFIIQIDNDEYSIINALNNFSAGDLQTLHFINQKEIGTLETAINNSNLNAIEVFQSLAIQNFNNGNHEQVIPYLTKALELDDKNIDTLYNISYILKEYGEIDLAKKYYKQINKIDDDITKLGIDLGISKNTLKENYNDNSKPEVSIVIPVLNKIEYTQRCIEAIYRDNTSVNFEVIIIDNGSTDGTKKYLNSLNKENLIVISNTKNLGFVDACNQGVDFSNGKYIVFLNNDTVPLKNWLEEMVLTIKQDNSIGIVGAKLIYPNDTLQEAGGIIWNDASGWNYGRGDNPNKPQYNFLKEVDYCSGACMIITKKLFLEVGGFDKRYSPAYYEDTDLCFSVRKLGYKVIYNPFIEIIHFEGITAGKDVSTGLKKYQEINKVKFTDKWKDILEKQLQPNISYLEQASIRNVNKRLIIIDKVLPWYDRASGSLRLYTMIKLFQSLGYLITFVALNGENQENYIYDLEKMGVEVYAVGSNRHKKFGDSYDLNQILKYRKYDIAFLSFYDVAEKYLKVIKEKFPDILTVIDTVDIHFLRELRRSELEQSDELYQIAMKTKEKELAIYSEADIIVTVTDEDKKILLNENNSLNIIEIPNIHEHVNEIIALDDRKNLLFIGNFNHIPNVDAVNYFVESIWPQVKIRIPGIKFYIVGNKSNELLKYDDKDIIITGYVPDTQTYLQSCRVSVAPLRFGAGMKGKIGEALISGIPVVTTSIGAEGMGLEDGKHLMIADRPDDFVNKIVNLYNNPYLWGKLAEEGREYINEMYSPEKVLVKVRELDNIAKEFSCRDIQVEESIKNISQENPNRNTFRGNFVTLFPETNNVHLTKDVGMIGYTLFKEYGYSATIACYKNGEYPYLNNEVSGLKLDFIRNTGNVLEDGRVYLQENSRNIDILHLFHLDKRSLFWIQTYKSINPQGKVYLKLDADNRFKDIMINKDIINVLEKCNVISVETKGLYKYLNEIWPLRHQSLEKEWPLKIEYLPNGFSNVAIDSKIEYEEKENIICTVGRIGTVQKATEILFESFKLVSPKIPNWKLRIIGPIEEQFKPYIEKFFALNPELREKITLTGNISDKLELENEYKKAKIFCLTSRFESFGLVLADAAKNGCYIISSNIFPAWDITNNGQYGDIFEIDNIKQLSDSLIKNCNDDIISGKSREIQNYVCSNFNWKDICGNLIGLLGEDNI